MQKLKLNELPAGIFPGDHVKVSLIAESAKAGRIAPSAIDSDARIELVEKPPSKRHAEWSGSAVHLDARDRALPDGISRIGVPVRARTICRVEKDGHLTPIALTDERLEHLSERQTKAYEHQRAKEFSELGFAKRAAAAAEWKSHLEAPLDGRTYCAGAEMTQARAEETTPKEFLSHDSKFRTAAMDVLANKTPGE